MKEAAFQGNNERTSNCSTILKLSSFLSSDKFDKIEVEYFVCGKTKPQDKNVDEVNSLQRILTKHLKETKSKKKVYPKTLNDLKKHIL